MIRVLIADDHPIVREGFGAIVNAEADIQVVNEPYGGFRYFKPLSDSAMEWMEENLSDETSFLNGELVVESRYADDIMESLATDGMVSSLCRNVWKTRPQCATDAMSQ